MKSLFSYILLVMICCCSIHSKVLAQSYGVESNGDGSYTIYMNGGSITTNTMGQYSSPSFQYDMSTGQGYWTSGQGSMCTGCYAVPNYTSGSSSYPYQSSGNTYFLSSAPPTGYDPSLSHITSAGIYFQNSAGVSLGFVPTAVANGSGGYSYINGYTEGCPSCASAAAAQAAATQWTNNNINLFLAQSATLQQNILSAMQAQMTAAMNLSNPFNYTYYYYAVAYLVNGNTSTPVPAPPTSPPGYTPTNVPTESPNPCNSADFNGVSSYVTPSGKPFTLPPGSQVYTSRSYDYDLFPNGALYMFILPDGTKYAAYTIQYLGPVGSIVISSSPEFMGYFKLNADGTWVQPLVPYSGNNVYNPPAENPDGTFSVVRMKIEETPTGCKLVKELVKINKSTAAFGIEVDDNIYGASPVSGAPKCEMNIPCPSTPVPPPNMPPPVPNIASYLNENGTGLTNFLKDNTKNSVKMYLYDCATGKVQYTVTKNGVTPISGAEQDNLMNKFNNGTFTSSDEDIAIKGCLSNGKWNYDVKLNDTKLNPHAKVLPVLEEVKKEIRRQADQEAGPLKNAKVKSKEERYAAGNDEFYKKSMNLLQAVTAIYDIGKDIINDGKLPDKLWDKGRRDGPTDMPANVKYMNSPFHLPTYMSGGTDQLIDEVTGTLQLVKAGYEFVRHPKKTFQTIWTGVSNLNYAKIKQIALDVSGANNYTQGGDRAKYQAGKHTVQAAMIVFAGVKILTKGTSVVKDAGSNVSNMQHFIPDAPGNSVADAIKNAQQNAKLITPSGQKLLTRNVENGSEVLVVIEKKQNTPEVFKTTPVNNIDEIPKNALDRADADDIISAAEEPTMFQQMKNQPDAFIQGKNFESAFSGRAFSDPNLKASIAQKAGLANLDGFTQIQQVQIKLPNGGYMNADLVWFKQKTVNGQVRYDIVIGETKLSTNAPFTNRQNQFLAAYNSGNGTTAFELRSLRFGDPASNLVTIPQGAQLDVKAYLHIAGNGTASVSDGAFTITKL